MSIVNIPPKVSRAGLSRRRFIGLVVFSGVMGLSRRPAFSSVGDLLTDERSLSLYNPHTKEFFEGNYWRNGQYVSGALTKINYLMRDIRTGEVKAIDTDLLDLICSISAKLRAGQPFHVISGYRSPQTNALLRKRGRAAAKNSFHVKGKAVDVRLPSCKLSSVRRTAYELKSGGVGFYPRLKFVHIDVGPVRYWNGNSRKS